MKTTWCEGTSWQRLKFQSNSVKFWIFFKEWMISSEYKYNIQLHSFDYEWKETGDMHFATVTTWLGSSLTSPTFFDTWKSSYSVQEIYFYLIALYMVCTVPLTLCWSKEMRLKVTCLWQMSHLLKVLFMRLIQNKQLLWRCSVMQFFFLVTG